MNFRLVALSAIAGLVVLSARLVSADELSAKVKATKKSEAGSGQSIGFRAGSGFGVFQDVQIPINAEEGMRGDGKTAGAENSDHMGMPLYAGLTVRSGDPGKLVYEGDLDFLMMRATSGPAETQSASYSRTSLSLGARYAFGRGVYRPTLAGHGILRRSSYDNVSNGHYVNAALLRGGIGLWSADLGVEAFASAAPYTELGFSSGREFFGGKRFASGEASVGEIGLLLSYRIGEAVWLDLGLEQEIVTATLGRVDDYKSFGLGVESAPARRQYELVTSTARIGVRKQL